MKVIVADQGRTEKTRLVMERYRDHPNVRHVPTSATCLWENWRAAAEAADTPYVSWLQDDDVVSRIYASRIIDAFDKAPHALHWQARCYCAPTRDYALWWGVNGPAVALDMINMQPLVYPGELIPASMFFLSWALSPGVAFRNGEEFRLALEAMPRDVDLFSERLILAAMAAQGPFIADPVTAGYWIHHGSNESYKQNADGSLPRQMKAMIDHLDDLLDRMPGWREGFLMWCRTRSPLDILRWLESFEPKESRYADDLRAIMNESLQGRVEMVPAPGQAAPEPMVVWD